MTLPMNRNYGGNLQAFALMKTLRGLGHRPVLLNRRNSKAEPSKTPEDLALDAAIPLYSSNIGLGKNVPNRGFCRRAYDAYFPPVLFELCDEQAYRPI
ncbi:hypothetical protein [Falsirhodobacter sp. alg1]|uniref:hypothetical protein n=1 Tax=Falsirhodobacter sp. alg1 TaxID=1472418 RepID=UPI00128EAE67|nr:hypothetical protein [Falsirhodobacter sp. alg1]